MWNLHNSYLLIDSDCSDLQDDENCMWFRLHSIYLWYFCFFKISIRLHKIISIFFKCINFFQMHPFLILFMKIIMQSLYFKNWLHVLLNGLKLIMWVGLLNEKQIIQQWYISFLTDRDCNYSLKSWCIIFVENYLNTWLYSVSQYIIH